MIKEKNFIDIILTEFDESRTFFITSILCLLAESPNIYWLFNKLSAFQSPFKEIQAGFASFVITIMILVYTVKAEQDDVKTNNIRVAFWFAVFTSFISICYYVNNLCIGEVTYENDLGEKVTETGFIWNWLIIPAIGFSVILPTTLYYNARNISLKKVFEKFEKHITLKD